LFERKILDSRGNPTVKVSLVTEFSISVRAAVPSGASTAVHEARELRDGDKGRYLSKAVKSSMEAVNTSLSSAPQGAHVSEPKALDARLCELHGTPN